jgi:hypothetical protein
VRQEQLLLHIQPATGEVARLNVGRSIVSIARPGKLSVIAMPYRSSGAAPKKPSKKSICSPMRRCTAASCRDPGAARR